MSSCSSITLRLIGALICFLAAGSQNIRGTPGVDYPSYPEIPKTSFRCSEQEYIPGFYADLETKCQVFHLCFGSRQESFLCPAGTIFNQEILTCDSWYSFNCSLAMQFYSVNAGPIIEIAGKTMLQKIEENSRDDAQAPTLDEFQKTSSLYEEGPAQTLLDSNVDNTFSEDASEEQSAIAMDEQKSETIHEKNAGDDKGSTDISEGIGKFIAALERIRYRKKPKDDVHYPGDESDIDVDESVDFFSEFVKRGFVYDPLTGEFNSNKYDFMSAESEEDWEDELEDTNEDFRDFYGDYEDISLHSENQPTNILGNYVNEQVNVEGIKAGDQTKKSPENVDLSDQNSFNEFSKRILGTDEQPRRSRRKPVYVVLDDAERNFSSEQDLNVFLAERTESSYFTEPISIDDLISESNTEGPLQHAIGEDFRALNPLQKISSEEEESVEGIKLASPDLTTSSDNSQTLEKFQVSSVSDLESLVLDLPQQEGESEVETVDFIPFENKRLTYHTDEPVEDVTDEKYLDEGQFTYSETDFLQDEPETDISYDDSEVIQILPDLSEEGVLPESLADDQRLVYIPDTMGYEASEGEESEGAEYNPMSYRQNEDWAYMYSDSPENHLSEDSYGSNQADEQDFESEETSNYDSYEYIDQSYAPDSPENVDSQYSASEYELEETGEQFSPRDYRLILDNRNFQTYPVPGVSYQSEDVTNPKYHPFDLPISEDLAGNPYYSDGAWLEESGVGSHGYLYVHPNMQQVGNMNDYPYSQQFDYVYDGLNGISYPYENDFEYLEESVKVDDHLEDSLNLKLSKEPETDEYVSESAAEGKDDFERLPLDAVDETNEETGREDLMVDYAEYEANRQSDSDDIDGSEEIYVFDFDEDSSRLEATAEQSYDSLNLDQEVSLDSNYPENDELKEFGNLSGESEHDSTKSLRGGRRATDSLKFSESGSNDISASLASSVTSEDNKGISLDSLVTADDISINGDVSQSKNVKRTTDDLLYHTFENKENEKTVIFSTVQEHKFADSKPAKDQSFGRDFVDPSELFMNNMEFPNSMGFGPYGYGNSNIGQQFSMIDNSNRAAISKKSGEMADNKENDQTRLSKLSSLKDKVLSMKRGKFGMFKKSLKNLK